MEENGEQKNDSAQSTELDLPVDEKYRTEAVAKIFRHIYPFAARKLESHCHTVEARTNPWKFNLSRPDGGSYTVPRVVSEEWLKAKTTGKDIIDATASEATPLTPLEITQLENFASFLVLCLKERKHNKDITEKDIPEKHKKTLSSIREDNEVFHVKQLVKNLVRGPNVKDFLAEWTRFEKDPTEQPQEPHQHKSDFSRLDICEDIENKALLTSKAIDAINSGLEIIDNPNLATRFWKTASRSNAPTFLGSTRSRFRKTSNLRTQLSQVISTDFYRPVLFGIHPSFPEMITETSSIPPDAKIKRVNVTADPVLFRRGNFRDDTFKTEAAALAKTWIEHPNMIDEWFSFSGLPSISPKDRNLVYEVEEQGTTKYYGISLSNLTKTQHSETRPEFEKQTLSRVITEAVIASTGHKMVTAREDDGFIPLKKYVNSARTELPQQSGLKRSIVEATRAFRDTIGSTDDAAALKGYSRYTNVINDLNIVRRQVQEAQLEHTQLLQQERIDDTDWKRACTEASQKVARLASTQKGLEQLATKLKPESDTKNAGRTKQKAVTHSLASSSASAVERTSRMENLLQAIMGPETKDVDYMFGRSPIEDGWKRSNGGRADHWHDTALYYSLHEPTEYLPYYFDRKREEERKSKKTYTSGGFATLKPIEERMLIDFMDYLHIALGRLPDKEKNALANNSRLNHASTLGGTDWPLLREYICKQCLKQLVRSEHRERFFDAWRQAHAIQENWPILPITYMYRDGKAQIEVGKHDKYKAKWVLAASTALNWENVLVKKRGDTILTALTQNNIRTRVLRIDDYAQQDKTFLHPSIKAQSLNLDTDFCKGVPYGESDLFPRKIESVSALELAAQQPHSDNELSPTGHQPSGGLKKLKSAYLSPAFIGYLNEGIVATASTNKEAQVWNSIESLLKQYKKDQIDIDASESHFIALEAEREDGHTTHFQISIKDFLNSALDAHADLSLEALHKMIYVTLAADTKKWGLEFSKPTGLIESFETTDGYVRNGKINLSLLAQRSQRNLLPTQPIHEEIRKQREDLQRERVEIKTHCEKFQQDLTAILTFDHNDQQQANIKALATSIETEWRTKSTELRQAYGEKPTANSVAALQDKLNAIDAEHGATVQAAWQDIRKDRYAALDAFATALAETRKHIVNKKESIQAFPPQANLGYLGEKPDPANVALATICKENMETLPATAVRKGKPITVVFVSLDEHALRTTTDGTNISVVPRKHLNDLIEKLQRSGRSLDGLVSGEVLSFTPVSQNYLKAGAQKLAGKWKR